MTHVSSPSGTHPNDPNYGEYTVFDHQDFFDELNIIFKKESRSDSGYVHYLELIKKLKEETAGYEEEITDLKEEVLERTTYSVLPEEGKFMDENKELKEENEKLKYNLANAIKDCWCKGQQLEDFVEENEDTLASLNFYKEQNGELKEEIEKLKSPENHSAMMDDYLENYLDDKGFSDKDMDKILEEHKKYETELFTIHHGTQLETGLTIKELKEEIQTIKSEYKKLEGHLMEKVGI